MLLEERINRILTVLSERNYLSLKDAESLFSISPATARRDFIELETRKLGKRTRGGIRFLQEKRVGGLPPLDLRKAFCSIEKETIAHRASGLIKPEEVVILDGGTTTLYLAKCLPAHTATVITNSLAHVMAIHEGQQDNPQIEVVLTGGIVFPNWALTYGPPALECLANYRAHWLFLSGQGLNEEGLFNPSALVVEAERAMVHCADKIVVMADHTKIGGKSMSRVCELEKIDILITTDVDENTDFLASLEEMGIEVIRVKIEGL